MSTFSDDIEENTDNFFSGSYEVQEARIVPRAADIKFGKHGKQMELAMMFVDIRESTKIVDGFRRTTAARMYKSFLQAVVKIVKKYDGEVKSFNGDGVLAVFGGDYKCNNAALASYAINWYVVKVLRPIMEKYFSNNQKLQDMEFNYGIGVDLGTVLIVRAGIKGTDNSDLVWAGNATNISVKLNALSSKSNPIYITNRVYNRLDDKNKTYIDDDGDVWEKRYWIKMNNMIIYRTDYWRKP